MEAPSELRDTLESVFEDVRDDYSGRGMYGSTCIGIVTDDPWEAASSIADLLREAEDEDSESPLAKALEHMAKHSPRTDSMGMSTILYWPNVHVED